MEMPKLKTKSGAKKRFGRTASGKIKVANAYKRHRLISKSKRAKTYAWSYSVGGKTWIMATSTPIASTTITGLPPLTLVGFRVIVSDSLTVGQWSQVTSIFVH